MERRSGDKPDAAPALSQEPDERPERPERLPSRPSAGQMIGGMLATLDQALTNRPRPVTQIQEEYREPWATAEGVTVDGLDERPDRPEPPDDSGARL
jgi:hypothetical protein